MKMLTQIVDHDTANGFVSYRTTIEYRLPESVEISNEIEQKLRDELSYQLAKLIKRREAT